jgi:hypothetical protein
MVSEYDRRMGRSREWSDQVETERDEEEAAESNADTAKANALCAVRSAAFNALGLGIPSWAIARFAIEVMEFSASPGWDRTSIAAFAAAYVRNLDGSARDTDVGASWLPWHDCGDGG